MDNDINSRLDRENAPGWRPSVGNKVSGEIVAIDMLPSAYGQPDYPVITIRQDDVSEVAVHCFHEVLRREVARRKPEVGDTIGIKYLGRPDGRRYEAYKVVLDKAEPVEPDWDSIAKQADAELGDEEF